LDRVPAIRHRSNRQGIHDRAVAGLNAKVLLGGVVPERYTTPIGSIQKLLAESAKEFDEPPVAPPDDHRQAQLRTHGIQTLCDELSLA
jgi:hypothetical protein